MKTTTTTSRIFRGIPAIALALAALGLSQPVVQAAIIQSDSAGIASGFTVSATDLVNQGQSTLTSATRSKAPLHSLTTDFGGQDPNNTGLNVPYANDGAIGAFITSPWGKNVEYYPMTNPNAAHPLPVTYTFTLNTTLNPNGYDITNITSTCGYLWNKDWTSNQVFQVGITKDGSIWVNLGTYSYKPYTTGTESAKMTQVGLSNDGGGALDNGTYAAKNVTGIRITYLDTGNSGGFDGTAIKEIDVVGVASAALAVDAATSTVTASPTSVASDGVTPSTITVTLKDTGGTPVPGKTVTLASDRGATDTISAASGPSNGFGVVTFTVTSTTAGAAVFTATDVTDSNLVISPSTATVTFMSNAVSAGNSTVTASPISVVADGSTASTITVTLKNAGNNPLAGKAVTLAKTSGPGNPVIAPSSATTDGSGVATFTVTSTTVGADVFAATETADNVTVAQTATVTFTAGAIDAGTSTVVATPAIVPADGITTTTVTVTLKDATNNPVADKTVSLVSSRLTDDAVSAASGPSSASGVVTFTGSSTTSGSPVFTATETTDDPDVVLTQTATVTFVHVTAVTWAETLMDVSTTATGIEIANDGTLVRAYHFGNAGLTTDITVHDVPFTKGGEGGSFTDTAMGGNWIAGFANWNGNWNLNSITDPACHQLISSMTMASSSSTIMIGSLTVGHTYRLQLISNNPRHGQIGVEGATHTLSGGDNAKPVVLAATWVAGDDTLDMSMLNNDMHFNGYALHDLSGGAVTDYDTWLGEYTFAVGADTTPTGDQDGDGLSNQQEYAFGLDPTSGSSVSPISSQQLDKAGGTFKYTRRKTSGLTYIYQWSTTLSEPWTDFTPVTNPPVAASISATVEEVTIEVPAAQLENAKLFLRVKAE